MSTTIGYWYPVSAETISLHLFTLDGTRLTAPVGVPLIEVDPTNVPGYYRASLSPALPAGTVRSRVYRGSALVDDGFLTVDPAAPQSALIDDAPARVDVALSSLASPVKLHELTEEYEGQRYRFTADALANAPLQSAGPGGIPVIVDGFTARAREQMAGSSIVVHQPVWQENMFSRPIVRGDSYQGSLALKISVQDWPGPDLLDADAIVLTAIHLPARDVQFSWTGTSVMDDDTPALIWELTPLQTDQRPGLYAFDVEARWTGGVVHTLVGPDARLRIVDDQTKS